MKITDAFLAAVEPTEKLTCYRDDEQPGLTLRVYPTGQKAWYLELRIRGRLYNRKVGPSHVYKTREARTIVRQLIGELIQGVDSQAELKARDKAAKKEASERRKAETIELACERYIQSVELKPATITFYKKLLGNGLKPYAGKILKEVDPELIRQAFAEISERVSALHATKCVRFIRTLCLWRELPNPIPQRLRLATSKPRQARLDPGDGVRIWKELQASIKTPSGAYVAIMLLTGCRTNELSSLTVGQVDLAAGYFKLADTKNGRDHKVYLSEQASKVITRFVKGKKPEEVVFERAKEGRLARSRLQEKKEWSNHDLRKLFAIVAMEIGIPYPVIKAALNHTSGDVTLAHYAHATPAQLRACWERVAAFYTRTECSTSKTINEPHYGQQNVLTKNLISIMQH